ncbi:MAG: aminoglycoside phosphotransferase family protein, partial [Opitutaceae bacterium]|nr:aminoglycoside phosphotransferase family protein [Opitutaceae bacterium]
MGAPVFDHQTKNPNYPSLDAATPETVGRYLSSRNFVGPDELVLRVEPLGAHARNRLARIVTAERTFVLKQFRPWPSVDRPAPSPEERFRAETQFYRSARIADCARSALPEVLHQDAQAGCMILEDAGDAMPLAGRALDSETAAKLGWFLVSLHHHSRSVPACAHYRNEQVVGWQMARLFATPQAQGPAWRGQAAWLARWRERSPKVRYALEDALAALERGGSSLVHGDYSPANWVQNGHGPRVVDGEFSFFGPPEYDVGTYLAGLLLERRGTEVVRAAIDVIVHGCFRYEARLVVAFAGDGC